MPNPETGEVEPYYVIIAHPGWRDLLRMTAREQWYHDRHVERFNRRQERLGRPKLGEFIGQTGSWRGIQIVDAKLSP